MQKENFIKKYFETANYIVLSEMYLNKYLKPKNIKENDLKIYNPGHLGTSLSLNFILANLYNFINENSIKSQLVVGTGHSGAGLITNLWLNGTLEKYNEKYPRNKKGLNNLISDFGKNIRSEINPEYPETIYDGGELGYSLGVAYGYALDTNTELIPCVIGDGEAETGTLCSAWQLNKTLKTKGKVLPILNLNGLKMGSQSYLSKLSDTELNSYFKSLGYDVQIVDATKEKDIIKLITEMQNKLKIFLDKDHPILIFRSFKGFTLPNIMDTELENTTKVHKNPFSDISNLEKMKILKELLVNYDMNIFDENDNLLTMFQKFEISSPDNKRKNINSFEFNNNNNLKNIEKLEEYLLSHFNKNKGVIFSPDEIYSNKLGKLGSNSIEILNENLLQALYQGYVQAGNNGFYIAYEGFMSIISTMISQYYKYLFQNSFSENKRILNSLNYILTSTCWENTYSHQNPDFVNTLLSKDDLFYNIFYPKDGDELIRCLNYCKQINNKINVITTSKRHFQKYGIKNSNININIIKDCDSPELILCATGDYMLDLVSKVYEKLHSKFNNIKIVYVTNPKVLDINSRNTLSNDEFKYYFTPNIPVVYLYSGYPSIIKSLLYERKIDCEVLGYNDKVSNIGNLDANFEKNGISQKYIINLSKEKILKNNQRY